MNPPPWNFLFVKQLAGIGMSMFAAVKYGQYTSFPEVDCCRCLVYDHREDENGDEKQRRSFRRIGLLIAGFLAGMILIGIFSMESFQPKLDTTAVSVQAR
mmetsp:Transcript_121872/g.210756  ORF Transcript_121872/g.210756 Transcript_121872/m.210756 type:complete len:100 (-) Transcript_121872:63-362(-)